MQQNNARGNERMLSWYVSEKIEQGDELRWLLNLKTIGAHRLFNWRDNEEILHSS